LQSNHQIGYGFPDVALSQISLNLMVYLPMDLLEYQAKELFRGVGIPVLPSQQIHQPRDIKGLMIPYPVVLKSQVYTGGRARAGGIRFVENTIDAIAAAQAMFNLPMVGEYPKTLLAEAKYGVAREFYLAVVLNRSIRRPMLLGSVEGGVDVQTAKAQMHQVVVDGEFSPFYARRLALNMGLDGDLMNAVSDVIEKMYWLFFEKDLDLVEINPLGVSAAGEVMALDGKITVNDGALARHGDLLQLRPTDSSQDNQHQLQLTQEAQGTIGILCNGSGLTLATLDLVYQAGGKPACFLNIGSETNHTWQPEMLCDRLGSGLAKILAESGVQVVLVNLMTGIVDGGMICKTLLQFLQGNDRGVEPVVSSSPNLHHLSPQEMVVPQIVLRCGGCDEAQLEPLRDHPQVVMVVGMEEAIARTVQMAAGFKKAKDLG
jgi:succinyl-CoA synthetase beta subunit